MIIQTLNDKKRDEIIENKNLSDLINYLNNLNKMELNYVLGLILSDAYKINFYIDNLFDNDNSKVFDSLSIKKAIYNLKKECLRDLDFLLENANATKYFQNLELVNKALIFEELELNEKDGILNCINKYHILDKAIYSFTYDLDCFKNYYIDYTKKNKKISNTDNLVTEYLADKMIGLKELNFEKYISYILEYIRIYYKWNFYNKMNNIKENISKKDLSYLNVIKELSIGNILNILESDYEFLNVIMRNYLYYSTIDNKVSEKEVDEYFFNNTDELFQKKLKIKRQ